MNRYIKSCILPSFSGLGCDITNVHTDSSESGDDIQYCKYSESYEDDSENFGVFLREFIYTMFIFSHDKHSICQAYGST